MFQFRKSESGARIERASTNDGRIYMPAAPSSRVTKHFLGNAKSGRFRTLKTADLILWHVNWPALDLVIKRFDGSCELCHPTKPPHDVHYGLNMPLSPPALRWERLTMDFITNLRESVALGYTRISLILNFSTQNVTYLRCGKDINCQELARIIFKHLFSRGSVPDNVATNHGKEFNSWFWDRVCSHLSFKHWHSAGFYLHLDSQTEWQNNSMEPDLLAFGNYDQDNWFKQLLLGEFPYTHSIHHSTLMICYWANNN